MPGHLPPGYKPSESLADHIRDLAGAFANTAGVLSDHYTNLNTATNGLLDGTYPWKGKSGTSFSDSWQIFGQYMQSMQKSCEDTHASLIKFAGKLDDIESQQGWDLLMTVVGGILTIVSLAAAIAEAGLNPFVDSFLVFIAGFTEQDGTAVANVAEEVTQADSEAATELQAIEDELTTSPTLSGPSSGTIGNTSEPISPLNLNEMMLTIEEETSPEAFNPDEFSARGSGKQFQFQNDAFFNSKPGMNLMPPGLNDPEAQYWIKQIEAKGVQVVWNHDVQVDLLNRNAYGITYNPVNWDLGPDASPQYMTVGLSPDADATTVYEEYLHVTEAESRGWLPYNDYNTRFEENYAEEIRVEYQVMQNAQRLGTTQQEWNILSTNRQYYIQLLKQAYGNTPIPADIQQFFRDPPMPPNLPK